MSHKTSNVNRIAFWVEWTVTPLLMTYSEASHQAAINILWTHFWGALISYNVIFSLLSKCTIRVVTKCFSDLNFDTIYFSFWPFMRELTCICSSDSQVCSEKSRDIVEIWILADLWVTVYESAAASLAAASKYMGVVDLVKPTTQIEPTDRVVRAVRLSFPLLFLWFLSHK